MTARSEATAAAKSSAVPAAPQPRSLISARACKRCNSLITSVQVWLRCSDGLQAKPWRAQAKKVTITSTRFDIQIETRSPPTRPRPARSAPTASTQAISSAQLKARRPS
jgi:hypothetical protein